MVPDVSYEYVHPEGTGKSVPPFFSIWFCGIPAWMKTDVNSIKKTAYSRIACSIKELQDWKVIAATKRLNPKQRKKLKMKLKDSVRENQMHIVLKNTVHSSTLISPKESTMKMNKKAIKKKRSNSRSKHRDEHGVRKKKRF